ncbi:hypothetical protein L6452_36312 [Arctium lappa]|uniref:Uncharacterized protein n=1 Tax=Arctium lappa TaxID=4217 RepID=A0ACB8Y8V6_ARCLA|nr:hypothetical protein L6452_36312 [Arctium lappa]
MDPPSPLSKNTTPNTNTIPCKTTFGHAKVSFIHHLAMANLHPPIQDPISKPNVPNQIMQNRKRISIRDRLKNSTRKKPKAEEPMHAETEDGTNSNLTTSKAMTQKPSVPVAGPVMHAFLDK